PRLLQAGYEEGHEFKEAENGKVALALACDWQPDVIITDWHMPEMDGIELIETLTRRGSNAMIGLVTSERDPQHLARAFQAGVSFILGKPFTPSELQETLLSALAQIDTST
ncbi:MAG: response regulator, partial [Methylococcaceae bacterium]